ncbi:LOW QUALITY PROTEIN: potassium channel subfamily U member 1-like [Pelodytes ibericus]
MHWVPWSDNTSWGKSTQLNIFIKASATLSAVILGIAVSSGYRVAKSPTMRIYLCPPLLGWARGPIISTATRWKDSPIRCMSWSGTLEVTLSLPTRWHMWEWFVKGRWVRAIAYLGPLGWLGGGWYLAPSDCLGLLGIRDHWGRGHKVRKLYHLWQPIRVQSKTMLDSTGMFHWCKEVPLETAALTHREAALMNFQDHIVVSIFGEFNSTLIGLRDFIMPLSTSNLAYDELKPIIFLGELSYRKREWTSIQYFPKLYLFPGSGLSCANLRSVNIYKCSMCVIMSSVLTGETKQYMEDTECILATLNMRSMNLRHRPSTSGNTTSMNMPGQKESLPWIPVITELKKATNITFINEENKIPKHAETEPHLTSIYATGSVFSEYFLDALMPMTYFNWQVLALLQTLVTGGSTPELEEQLADEDTLTKCPHAEHAALRDRCKLSLIPLIDPRFPFNEALEAIRPMEIVENNFYVKYVITRPVKHFPLLATDLLYCVVPFQEQPSISEFGGQQFTTIEPFPQEEVLQSSEIVSTFSKSV